MKTQFIKGKLYTNPDSGIVIQCTRDGYGSTLSGRVVIPGTDRWKVGHWSKDWCVYVFKLYESMQEPELQII
jgi:hypothetical protein